MKKHIPLYILIFGCFLCGAHRTAFADNLEIRNQSGSEILNIMVTPVKQETASIFLRLDLLPGAADTVQNPDVMANLRVDTGLQFWLYDAVDLASANRLTFCADYPGCLAVSNKAGETVYETLGVKNLVPSRGERPVCQLDKFHPRMPMKEVCALLEKDIPRDDNGSCLTGLGFAGKVWAARLAPFQDEPINENSLLEHMELRKSLSREDVVDVLATLYKQGYIPWQAEFPNLDLDFTDMTKLNESERKSLLAQAIDKFLASQKTFPPQVNNAADEDAEANILLAPAYNIDALANADNPPEDVQLFTMILKPMTSTLLLDVSAYQGGNEEKAQDR